MVSLFQKSLEKHLELFNRLICVERDVEIACLEIVESLDSDGKVMFCGNGGSAADCQHLAAELPWFFRFSFSCPSHFPEGRSIAYRNKPYQ